MERYRKVRKWGNSLVILLTKFDVKDFGIEEGDMINIEDCNVKKGKRICNITNGGEDE